MELGQEYAGSLVETVANFVVLLFWSIKMSKDSDAVGDFGSGLSSIML